MIKVQLILMILQSLLLFISTHVSCEERWHIAIDGPHVDVYTRPYKSSSLVELMGEMSIRTSLSSILALIDDSDFNASWVPSSGGVEILKRVSWQEIYARGIILAPWPFSNRDTVVRFMLNQNPDTLEVIIEMTGVPSYYAHQENYVRIPSLEGSWKLTPQANGIIKINYRIYADSGGYLPSWVMNSFSVDNVYNMLLNLRRVVKKEKYQSARIPNIKEP